MALTRFPVETDQPTVQVTLPPGKHTLELVVEDSAGLTSAPDTVTITVVQEVPVPSIRGIEPTRGLVGATVNVIIAGANLLGASEVRFSGTGIAAEILRGGTANELPVRLTIDARAPLGAQSFVVVTPGGMAKSPPGVVFTINEFIPPRPVVVEPRPVIVEPTPVIVEPRPVIVEPTPVTPEPRLVVTEPGPLTPEPRLAVPEPGPVGPVPRGNPKKSEPISSKIRKRREPRGKK